MGKTKGDEASYTLAISACREVANQASGKMSLNASSLESTTLIAYRKAYEEKMIYEGFDEMMSEYSEVVEELKTILGMDDADIDSFSDKEDEPDDMEVLEFLPEQEE